MANFYGSYIGYGGGGAVAAWAYQGTLYGYLLGGNTAGYPTVARNEIQKWIFATDSDAADIANLTVARDYCTAGLTSETYGYTAAGGRGANHIERWVFSSEVDATEVGETVRAAGSSAGSSTGAYGYIFHGHVVPGNKISKFTIADGTNNAADVTGDLLTHKVNMYGCTSETKGYVCGGYSYAPSPTGTDANIQSMTFADDSISGDIGDMWEGRSGRGSASSVTHGYCGPGDAIGPGSTNTIDKFSFADESSVADVGNIDASSTYATGGAGNTAADAYWASGNVTDAIDKLNFESGGNANQVAGVALPVNEAGGTHV